MAIQPAPTKSAVISIGLYLFKNLLGTCGQSTL